MRTVITYATNCTLTIKFVDGCDLASADWREQYKTLGEAIAVADVILHHDYPMSAKCIDIWDSNTGEILAQCFNKRFDEEEEPSRDEDYDWDYNEDEGYDPYEGCYTWDC